MEGGCAAAIVKAGDAARMFRTISRRSSVHPVREIRRLFQKRTRSMARNYFVNIAELTGYSPANHTETVNKRVIGPETVGANQLEVVLGHVKKNAGALPHAHPGIEQVCYMLEGRARVEVGGQSREIGPGEACFFPADEKHVFTATSDEVKVLVIYAPPYGENPKNAIV